MATKNELANEIYGEDFADLSAGKKSKVTREYNAQDEEEEVETSSDTAVVKVGRVGNGPVKEFILSEDTTVEDLLNKAGLEIDTKKESIIAQSDGSKVNMSDEIEDGETYVVTPEIKSA